MKKILSLTALAALAFSPVVAESWWQKALNTASEYAPQIGAAANKAGLDSGAAMGSLSQTEIINGLKEALKVGSSQVVKTLGQEGGFLNNEAVKILLPDQVQKAQSVLNKVGLGSLGDDVVQRMNRAAEQAMPHAKEVFLSAINEMTLEDGLAILQGENDAATQYFKQKMSPTLTEKFSPIVNTELANAGALQAYNTLTSRYNKVPFVPDLTANLTDYTVGKALEGAFMYLAKEEAAIRANPAARTTELLQKVFAK